MCDAGQGSPCVVVQPQWKDGKQISVLGFPKDRHHVARSRAAREWWSRAESEMDTLWARQQLATGAMRAWDLAELARLREWLLLYSSILTESHSA